MHRCPKCGTEVPPTLVSCPLCGSLFFEAELAKLEQEAQVCLEQADIKSAVQKWRQALSLVPNNSPRANQLTTLISQHSEKLTSSSWGGLGLIGALLWKGKALLAGLTKAPTLLSMLFTITLYAQTWGWIYGIGIILLIYVHEMGHVFELTRLGFQFEAPRFIPGFGAFVLLKEKWTDPVEDAQIGLAGPRWGLIATLICFAIHHWTQMPVFNALTRTSAWLNLVNLVPFWTLDGARAARALSRSQLYAIVALATVLWASYQEHSLLFLIAFTLLQSSKNREKPAGHEATFWEFVFLVSSLWYLSI